MKHSTVFSYSWNLNLEEKNLPVPCSIQNRHNYPEIFIYVYAKPSTLWKKIVHSAYMSRLELDQRQNHLKHNGWISDPKHKAFHKTGKSRQAHTTCLKRQSQDIKGFSRYRERNSGFRAK